MTDDSHNRSISSRSNLAVKSLNQVKATSPELPSPSLITDAMVPEIVTSEWREGVRGVSNEASSGVGVEPKHEGDEQVVSVPERLKGLLTNLGMGGRVHEEHTKKHDVAGDASCLGVMDLERCLLADLGYFNVEEAANC